MWEYFRKRWWKSNSNDLKLIHRPKIPQNTFLFKKIEIMFGENQNFLNNCEIILQKKKSSLLSSSSFSWRLSSSWSFAFVLLLVMSVESSFELLLVDISTLELLTVLALLELMAWSRLRSWFLSKVMEDEAKCSFSVTRLRFIDSWLSTWLLLLVVFGFCVMAVWDDDELALLLLLDSESLLNWSSMGWSLFFWAR